jgi:predicted nuclease with TOPRIM domain
MKICPKCNLEKQDDEFYKSNQSKDGLRTYCKLCDNAVNKKQYEQNKPERLKQIQKWSDNNKELRKAYQRKNKERNRLRDRLRKYKLTVSEFSRMLKVLDDKCEICSRILDSSRKQTIPHIDHDHVDNKVRGILCHSCNQILGHSYDNIAILRKAISYLEDKGA